MDNEHRSGSDSRFPGLGTGWIFLAVIASALAVGIWLNFLASENIGYTDLLRLIKASARTAPDGELLTDATGDIDITMPNSNRTFRYSNLRDVRIADTLLEGRIDRVELVDPDAAKKDAEPTKKDKETSPSAKETAVVDGKTRTIKADSLKANLPFRTVIGKEEWNQGVVIAALKEANISYPLDANSAYFRNMLPYAVLFSITAVALIVLIRRLGGPGAAMAFGRSRGKLHAQEDLGVTFNDVAGIDEAVEEVREVVDFLRSPDKYQRLGGRIPKGVLLVGPPGTGKTLLAKAIAGEAGVPFFSLSGSDFVEMFVGVGAARVRDMFLQAEAKAPCILFIDELDALGKSRGHGHVGGGEEREQTLNALLVEMDGFSSNAGIIVLAATNRPETLDQALLRGGRFDRQVLVDRPDIRGREDILKVHVKSVKLDPSVSLKEVASMTPGFVGADLANLVNEAALLAARGEKNAVGIREFHEGVERVMIGLEKKQRIMSEDDKRRIAYHEGGHALVAYSLPNTDPVHKVSIIPRGIGALGYVLRLPEGDRFLVTQAELESTIQVALAGTVAEEMVFNEFTSGAANDLERATEIARSMVMEYGMSRLGRINYRENNRSIFLAGAAGGDEKMRTHSEQTLREIDLEVKRILDEALQRVRSILQVRRPALEAIAKRLIEKETMDAAELKQVMLETSPGPQVVPGTSAVTKPQTPREGDSAGGSAAVS